MEELIAAVQDHAAGSGKPVWLGEFGVPRSGDPERDLAVFEAMVEAIEAEGAALAAFWVFELGMQEGTWNVTFENERAGMIEVVGRANARLPAMP